MQTHAIPLDKSRKSLKIEKTGDRGEESGKHTTLSREKWNERSHAWLSSRQK
jgi:hypothetical protein